MIARRPFALLASRISHLAVACRRVFGMPDYAAYVAQLREAHPGCSVPTEREFFDQYLKGRYESGATRCC